MKKLIITFGSLLIMAFVVVLFVNASEAKDDNKKVKSDTKKVEMVSPCSTSCNHTSAVPCDPEKCKQLNCDHKNGKCDPATCTAHKDAKCDPTTCPKHSGAETSKGHQCGVSATCPGHPNTSTGK